MALKLNTTLQEQHDLWLAEQRTKEENVNPCVRTFGLGPDGAKCKTCQRLLGRRFAKTYYKCALREETRGAGSDHRVNWPACGQYLEARHG